MESVRRGLLEHAVGRRIATVSVLSDRAVRRHLPGRADFQAVVAGHRVLDVRRRGKYLWWVLDDGDAMLAHLGMSGQFRVGSGPADPAGGPRDASEERVGGPRDASADPAGGPRDASADPAGANDTHPVDEAPGALGPIDEAPGTARPDVHPHLRVRFTFTDGGHIDFLDQRTFGGLAYCPGQAELPDQIAHIALDPLDPQFDLAATVARIRSKKTDIKRALLDQTVVSGIGNIYADEALWRARVNYARSTAVLTRPVVRRVLEAAAEVMTEALAAGGTSFDALYVNVNGDSGYFDRSLAAYGQEGRPCPRCGTAIRRDAFMNRSSFFCPVCQPAPRVRR